MDEHLSLMSVHAKPSAPGETDVDAREVGRLVCGRKEDDRGEEKGEGRTGNESPAPLRPAGGKLDLFAKVCRIFFFVGRPLHAATRGVVWSGRLYRGICIAQDADCVPAKQFSRIQYRDAQRCFKDSGSSSLLLRI